MPEPLPQELTVIREDERAVVPFPGGATYKTLIGDDNGADIPIRTGIQTSQPGYATRVHSHPYVEVLTVLEGRGEAWLDGEPGTIVMEPGVTISIPAGRVHGFRGARRPAARHLWHPHLRQTYRQHKDPAAS